MSEPPANELLLEWDVAWRALEAVSGDVAVVAEFAGGALVAVIDGLGHGVAAAEAAREARRILEAAPDDPVADLIERCHAGLKRTRGVVLSVVSIDVRASILTWAGVGNVEATLLRGDRLGRGEREALTTAGGIVGYQLPAVRPRQLPIHPGDLLVMWTDGIREIFSSRLLVGDVHRIAEAILGEHGCDSDDALVLVARYFGGLGRATDASERRSFPSSSTAMDELELRLPIEHEADVFVACRRVREIAGREGLGVAAAEAVAIAVAEVARNILVHARRGVLAVAPASEGGRRGVLLVAKDEGPGIPDVDRAMEDGFSTKGGLGLGLPSARRLVDEFRLESRPGGPTVVTLKKWGS